MKALWNRLSNDTQDLVMTASITLAIAAVSIGAVGGLVLAIAQDFHATGVI